jgi:hypothetical protein
VIIKVSAGLASLLLTLATALTLTVAPAPAAAPTECDGALTGGPFDNVEVPSGAHCEMVDAVVTGNVLVRADASLRASASQISGNVIGQNSAWVCLQFASSLGGDFLVKGGALHTTTGFDIGVVVGGHARVTDNAGLTFIDAANVGGNVDVSSNTGTLEIEFNTIGGNVTLANNVVPPVYTGGPAQPGDGGCGVPTSFILQVGGMSNINNTLPTSNMHVISNSGTGDKTVVGNTVKNIICLNNDPLFVGGPNTAQHAVGQCF